MLKLRDYQIKTINRIQSIHKSTNKIPVLAACPGAGKTIMSLSIISDYIRANPTAKILIMTHGTKVLRSQYMESMQSNFPHLASKALTVESSNEFNPKAQIVIALPQTLTNLDLTKVKYDLVIVDEAHQRYLGNQSQLIIAQIKPKHQLLLTGTPSKFIYENDKAGDDKQFEILAVALQDIKHVMAPLRIDIDSSVYKVKANEYNQDGEVIEAAVIKQFNDKTKTYKTTEMIIEGLFEKLKKAPFKQNVFNKIMVMAKSIEQATYIQNKLTRLGYTNISSNSENDPDSENIELFKNTQNYQFLVVVQRGILGFDDPSITAVVDMSGTKNLDRMYQAMARVVRKSKDNRFKLFIKMAANANESTIEYTKHIVNSMLCLTIEEYILNFNGSNHEIIMPPVERDPITKRVKTKRCEDGKTTTIAQVFKEPLNVLDCIQEAYIEYKSGLVTHGSVNLSEITRNYTGSNNNPDKKKRLIKEFFNTYNKFPSVMSKSKDEIGYVVV